MRQTERSEVNKTALVLDDVDVEAMLALFNSLGGHRQNTGYILLFLYQMLLTG